MAQKKQKFAIRLIQEGRSDSEIQYRVKTKYEEEISEQELQQLRALYEINPKGSPIQYFKQIKKRYRGMRP